MSRHTLLIVLAIVSCVGCSSTRWSRLSVPFDSDESVDFNDTATRTELSEGAARLRAAFDRLRDDAPDEVAFDDQFLRLVNDSDAAVDRLEDALEARDQSALVNALRELRSFERLLWLNFG